MRHTGSAGNLRKHLAGGLACLLLLLCPGCRSGESAPAESAVSAPSPAMDSTALGMLINDTEVSVQWEDNDSVRALMELVREEPLTITMSPYGGFEQVGPLGHELPHNDTQTTTAGGDIVLYNGNQIVVFYGTNSWPYTRLGHITDKTAAELNELLAGSDVTVTITCE